LIVLGVYVGKILLDENIKQGFKDSGLSGLVSAWIGTANQVGQVKVPTKNRLMLLASSLLFLAFIIISYYIKIVNVETSFIGFIVFGSVLPLVYIISFQSNLLRKMFAAGGKFDAFLFGWIFNLATATYLLLMAWLMNKVLAGLIYVNIIH